MKYKKWSNEELKQLQQLYDKGFTVKEIATQLKTTTNSVKSAKKRLKGLPYLTIVELQRTYRYDTKRLQNYSGGNTNPLIRKGSLNKKDGPFRGVDQVIFDPEVSLGESKNYRWIEILKGDQLRKHDLELPPGKILKFPKGWRCFIRLCTYHPGVHRGVKTIIKTVKLIQGSKYFPRKVWRRVQKEWVRYYYGKYYEIHLGEAYGKDRLEKKFSLNYNPAYSATKPNDIFKPGWRKPFRWVYPKDPTCEIPKPYPIKKNSGRLPKRKSPIISEKYQHAFNNLIDGLLFKITYPKVKHQTKTPNLSYYYKRKMILFLVNSELDPIGKQLYEQLF